MEYSSPNYLLNLLVTFICGVIFFWVLFVWVFKCSEVGWKKLELVLVGISLVTLISAAGEVRTNVASRMLAGQETRTRAMHDLYCSLFFDYPPIEVCMKYRQEPFSPKNLENIQADHDILCSQYPEIKKYFLTSSLPDFNVVPWDSMPIPIFSTDCLNGFLKGMQKQQGFYNEAATDLAKVRSDTKQTELELLISFLWPYVVALLLAFAGVKILAEIRGTR